VVWSSKNKRNKAKLENLVVAVPIRRSKRSTPSVYKSMGGQENPAPSNYGKVGQVTHDQRVGVNVSYGKVGQVTHDQRVGVNVSYGSH
jgi:hypothetical protein